MAKKIGIPEGMPSLTPHLHFNGNAKEAVAWYQEALGAVLEGEVVPSPDGLGVMHSMLRIGDSPFMVADAWPGWERGPEESTTVGMWVYVPDCDALWDRATGAGGGEVLMEMADMFWGDRMGQLKDPFGHSWSIATPIELTDDERAALSQTQLPS